MGPNYERPELANLKSLNLNLLKNGVTFWFNIKHDFRRFFWWINMQDALELEGHGWLKANRRPPYSPSTVPSVQQALKTCAGFKNQHSTAQDPPWCRFRPCVKLISQVKRFTKSVC